jgi:hypothetical protein
MIYNDGGPCTSEIEKAQPPCVQMMRAVRSLKYPFPFAWEDSSWIDDQTT